MSLSAEDMEAWQDLGRCQMTIKMVLSNLQITLQRLERSGERPDAYVVAQVKDAIRMCQTCLADCGETPL
jgi:hypothetical protein